jgi:peptide methionine sulfoxide reductase msrA/msrB
MIKYIAFGVLFISLCACAQHNKPVGKVHLATIKTRMIDLDTSWKEKIAKSDDEWKKILTPKQYYVLREHGTERPFSSDLYENKEQGVYVCAGCNNPLFSSDTKFDSGTGWPSYYKPYSSKSLDVHTDNSLGMSRDALTCKRCGGHLGHVFDDGPAPTGLRYCIDGDGLLFIPSHAPMSIATFAGGCFWCTETIFENIKGVSEVVSGYAGGDESNPSYESVGAGMTGHAESFQVYYDPKVISYADLLHVFFASIDPTTVDGQAPDFGKQYRTIAFYNDEGEKTLIENKIKEIAKAYSKPIATQIVKFTKFYEAEEYHQDFVRRNPNQGYVQAVSIPRREKTLSKVKELVKNHEEK